MVKAFAMTVCLSTAVLWGSAGLAGEEHSHQHAKVGHQAPEFSLKDTQGKTHSLSEVLQQEGVTAVVLEWFNHDCPVCQKHVQDKTMVELVNKYKDKGVVQFGVDSTHFHKDKEAQINKRITQWKLNYTILTDFDGKVGHVYGARTTPHMFVINKQGILVYDGAVDNFKTGDGKTNHVAAALEQVLKGETVAVSKTEPYGCSVKYKKN